MRLKKNVTKYHSEQVLLDSNNKIHLIKDIKSGKEPPVDGIIFASKREARRWLVLRELEKNGQISDLERQVKFELIPAQRRPDGKGKMRVVERAVGYVADFVYIKDGEVVAEDTKGYRTKDYIIKRKLMLFVNNVRVQEI